MNVDAGEAEAAWRDVGEVFDDVDRTMSRFRPESEISELNRRSPTAAVAPVSAPLYEALVLCERARRATNGRFDPRILTDLERLGSIGFVETGRTPGTAPNGDRQGPLLERSPRNRTVRLRSLVDLGGIGKGLALRWARRRLNERLAWSADVGWSDRGLLIDAGGDLVMDGPAPDGGPWRIAIEDPAGGSDPVAVFEVRDGAVATSSIRIHSWQTSSGETVHHVIDPETGHPAGGGLRSVTVAWPDPAWAEVWTKSLFVGGAWTIASEAEAAGLAAWWVDGEGRLGMTEPARTMTIWS